MSGLKFILPEFMRVWKPKPVCHLLLDMPPSQRTLNLSAVAVICLWFWGRGSGRRAHLLCQKETVPLWGHMTPAPSSPRSCPPDCKVPGLGGCTVAPTVWWGEVSPVVISTFPSPSQPGLKWVLLICCALSAQGVGKLQYLVSFNPACCHPRKCHVVSESFPACKQQWRYLQRRKKKTRV